MLNLGTVRACPSCKQGDVIIRSIITTGPTEVMEWDEEMQSLHYSHTKDDKETFYVLDCGHTVSRTLVEQEETPKFVRWRIEEEN